MEEKRSVGEAVDAFLLSDAAREFMRPGAEASFGTSLVTFVEQLDLGRLKGDHEYLDDTIESFAADSIDRWHLYHPREVDDQWRTPFWAGLSEAIEVGLEARWDREVSEGWVEVGRDEPERSPLASLTAHVQAFVQAVKDFVRGREMEEPTQEHGAER